ncbi:MAG: dipicolinate synthase subunit B [Lachnospiraceae bacterium]|nr:dipicolinate synthase subunit B [Lachnospiraceae bacterium]
MDNLKGMRIGFAVTGSFCTFSKILDPLKELVRLGAIVTPIFSFSTAHIDSRFYKAVDFRTDVEAITGNTIIDTIPAAEPIGPKKLLDLIIVAPCTGNTLAKLAYGITDTPVTMAVKAHLRNNRPVLIAVSTNDGLTGNASNLGKLLNTRNYYFVPFRQDDCSGKPNSLVADMALIPASASHAATGEQIQPLLR